MYNLSKSTDNLGFVIIFYKLILQILEIFPENVSKVTLQHAKLHPWCKVCENLLIAYGILYSLARYRLFKHRLFGLAEDSYMRTYVDDLAQGHRKILSLIRCLGKYSLCIIENTSSQRTKCNLLKISESQWKIKFLNLLIVQS